MLLHDVARGGQQQFVAEIRSPGWRRRRDRLSVPTGRPEGTSDLIGGARQNVSQRQRNEANSTLAPTATSAPCTPDD
ncbi:MAG: hypothetical protein ACREX8_09375, partial [Gammaproteobacteria bacterium]